MLHNMATSNHSACLAFMQSACLADSADPAIYVLEQATAVESCMPGHTHDAACGDAQLTNPVALSLQLKAL